MREPPQRFNAIAERLRGPCWPGGASTCHLCINVADGSGPKSRASGGVGGFPFIGHGEFQFLPRLDLVDRYRQFPVGVVVCGGRGTGVVSFCVIRTRLPYPVSIGSTVFF